MALEVMVGSRWQPVTVVTGRVTFQATLPANVLFPETAQAGAEWAASGQAHPAACRCSDGKLKVATHRETVPSSFVATNEPPRATLEHHHKASGDAFKSGFNLTLGCFAACGVVGALLIGGCIALSVVMAPEVERRQQQRKQEMEERLKKIDDAAEQIRRDYERSLRESQRQ